MALPTKPTQSDNGQPETYKMFDTPEEAPVDAVGGGQGQPETYKMFDTMAPAAPAINPQKTKNDALFHSVLIGQPVEAIRPALESGANIALDAQARQTTEANKQQMVRSFVDNPSQDGDLKALQDEILSIENTSRFVTPAEIALLSSPSQIQRDYAVQKVGRLVSAQSMILDKLGESSEEGFLTNFDFVDYALSSAQNLFLVDKQREYADRASQLMYDQTITPEQFEAEFNNILTEMGGQGFFEDNNRFYLGDFVDLFAAGSDSSVASWQKAFAAFDTVTFVLGGAPTAVKAGKVATTAVKVAGGIRAAVKTGAGTGASIISSPARMIGYKTNDPALVKTILDEARLMDDPSKATLLHNQTSPSIVTPDTLRPERWAHTSSAAVRSYEDQSKVLSEIKTIAGRAGSAVDKDKLLVLENKLQADAKIAAAQSGDMSYLDAHLYQDDLDNLVFAEIRGTDAGMSFTGPNGQIAAQNLADNIGGEVVEWQNPGHFVVVQTKNVPTGLGEFTKESMAIFTATAPKELGEGIVARWLGSPATQTTEANRAALLTAEGIQEQWSTVASNRIKEVAKLNSRSDRAEVDGMFEMLLNGKFANQREAFTEVGFRNEFALKYNKPPTDAQVALYLRVQDARDAESFFVADEFFKRQVNDGVQVLDDQYRVVPVRSETIPRTASVYDSKSGRTISADKIPEGQTVYKNYDPNQNIFDSNSMYILGDDLKTRRLYHSDILARNAGGTRMYKNGEINYYIKQDRTKAMADGSVQKVAPLTAMGVKHIDEADDVVRSLNKFIDEFGVALGKTKFTNSSLDALKGNAKIDNLIATNSKWNPSVHNLDSLLKWADEAGVDLSAKFDRVRNGEKLIDSDVAGGFAGMPFEMAMDARALNPRARRNSVLMGYGGKKNRTISPMKAMEKSTSELVANQSYRAYTARAINGLLKSAVQEGVLENGKELVNMTLRQKLMNAKIRDIPGAGSKLKLEQEKILFRLDRKGLGDAQWSEVMNNLSNYLYGKGFGRGADLAADMSSVNPMTAMRGFVFDAKLGMFNPSQLYVQASQVINIFAVGGTNGLRGGALYGPVRFALHNNNPAVIKRIGEVVAPISGISADEFVDMVSMFKDHGRSMIGVSLAEFGTDAATASSVFGETVGSVRKAGRFFFNEGELVARTTAWNTAYVEYLAKFPGKSPRSQQGVNWIMNRQDILTQSMSGASRTNLDRFPFTQFMSYQFRINEAIFAGSFGGKAVLTGAERLRLAATHTVLFGASGWAVAGTAMDYYNYRNGTDLDEGTYRAIRKGAMDYLLSEISGVDTSLSSRLGSGDNMFMLMKDMGENNIFETLGGPSLEVGGEALRVILGGAKNLAKGVTTGDFEDAGASLGRFARTFSTGNQAYNAYMAYNVGQYLTKDNALLDNGLTDMESIFISLGVPLEDHEEAFKFTNFAKFEKLLLGSTIKSVQKEWNLANAQLDRGEFNEASETMKGIALLYHSLPLHDRSVVEREVRRSGGTIVDNLTLRAMQHSTARDFNTEEK